MSRPPRTEGQAAAQIDLFIAQRWHSLKALSAGDGLSAERFLERNPPAHPTIQVTYRCFNRHTVELPLPTGPVLCDRCGARMRPQP